jgi:hypothetical protein
MLTGGARWAVARGWGTEADLERIEERGQMLHAKPGAVSEQAKKRQRDEMGTLGSGMRRVSAAVPAHPRAGGAGPAVSAASRWPATALQGARTTL